MPRKVPDRIGSPQTFLHDSPITEMGLFQARMTGKTFKFTINYLCLLSLILLFLFHVVDPCLATGFPLFHLKPLKQTNPLD